MKPNVCEKLVEMDDNILQATLLEKSNIVESYKRKDAPLKEDLPLKEEGFVGYLMAHIARKNEDRFGALTYQVIRHEMMEIILVPVSGDFTLRLLVRPGSTTSEIIRRIGGIQMPTTAGTG